MSPTREKSYKLRYASNKEINIEICKQQRD